MAKKTTDTRALTREAYPHLLAEGISPSVGTIKDWVRVHIGNPEWNPSATTVNEELISIRKETGELYLAGVKHPSVDPALAELTGEYFVKIHDHIRESILEELSDKRAEANKIVEDAQKKVEAAEQAVQQMKSDLGLAKQEFELKEIKLTADVEYRNEQIEQLRETVEKTKVECAELNGRCVELTDQVARITSEREVAASRHDSQLTLANQRYRELEKAKLVELDNARTQRNTALAEIDRLRNELSESRILSGTKSIEAAEARGEVKALQRQVKEITERHDALNAVNMDLQGTVSIGETKIKLLEESLATIKANQVAEQLDGVSQGVNPSVPDQLRDKPRPSDLVA